MESNKERTAGIIIGWVENCRQRMLKQKQSKALLLCSGLLCSQSSHDYYTENIAYEPVQRATKLLQFCGTQRENE